MLLRLLVLSTLVTAASAQLPNWFQRTPNHSPGVGPYLMQFDPVTRRCMLVCRGTGNQTWSWDGRDWTLLSASSSIDNYSSQMVWDSVRQRMLIVTSGTSSAQTRIYAWTGSTWNMVFQGIPFVSRDSFAATFDTGRGVIVFHGGSQGGSTFFDDTWEWNGTTWTQRSAGGPTQRNGHVLVYDSHRGVSVLFGGETGSQPRMLRDVWEWDGQQWREFFGVYGPAARTFAIATYDTVAQRVLVYAGTDRQSNYYRDLWSWDGVAWQQIATATQPTSTGALAFDTLRGMAVMQGYQPIGTWEFYDDQVSPGSFAGFGSGCAGTNGTPVLAGSGGAPRIGTTFPMTVTPVSLHVLSQVYGIAGFSTTSWNGLPLPFSMDGLGAPGCSLLAAIDDLIPLPRTGGAASWDFSIPFDRRLVGVEIDLQALNLDPGANMASVVLSNGARLRIGN